MQNNYIKYIRKDIETIIIDSLKIGGVYGDWTEHNLRRWCICNSLFESQYHNTIIKQFFVFIYIGDNFPIKFEYKEILTIIQKYKFSKVYISKQEKIYCYYFKRGVVFDIKLCNDINDKKFISLKRLFKLLKIKAKQS
jgi:hypothetical protein